MFARAPVEERDDAHKHANDSSNNRNEEAGAEDTAIATVAAVERKSLRYMTHKNNVVTILTVSTNVCMFSCHSLWTKKPGL